MPCSAFCHLDLSKSTSRGNFASLTSRSLILASLAAALEEVVDQLSAGQQLTFQSFRADIMLAMPKWPRRVSTYHAHLRTCRFLQAEDAMHTLELAVIFEKSRA